MSNRLPRRLSRHSPVLARAGALGGLAVLAAAGTAAAHGPIPVNEPPTITNLLFGWSFDPLPTLSLAAALLLWRGAIARVDAAHPANPVPRRRTVAFVAGMTTIAFALMSGIARYDTTLFSIHMVQHILLTMVAPPLLALSAPITLVLRVSGPEFRRSILLPILHSRLVRAISWPPVGWTVFAVVMWATHFSPLFDAALEDPLLHFLEHLLYLAAGMLFWWPVIGADPTRWRLSPIWGMAYLASQMPPNAAVGLAIYFAPTVLYAHYATANRAWGPDPFTDQQVAGILMWGVGDIILLAALVLAIAAWLRADEKRNRINENRGARNDERAAV